MDQNITSQNIRISMPSKGRLMEDTRAFFADCGISVHQENPRQYEALIPNMPGVSVLFQRPRGYRGQRPRRQRGFWHHRT